MVHKGLMCVGGWGGGGGGGGDGIGNLGIKGGGMQR